MTTNEERIVMRKRTRKNVNMYKLNKDNTIQKYTSMYLVQINEIMYCKFIYLLVLV